MSLFQIWIAMALLYAAAGVAYPLLPLYMSWNRLNNVEIGSLVSISSATSILALVIVGHLSDMLKRRNVLQAALCLGQALLSLLYGHFSKFYDLLILHTLYISISSASLSLSGAVAMDYVTGKKGMVFGSVRTSGAIGWILGTLAGGFLSQSKGYLSAFTTSSVVYTASALMYGLIPPPSTQAIKSSVKVRGFSQLKRRKIIAVLTAVLTASVSNPAYYTFLPLYLTQEIGASQLLTSAAFAITPFTEIPMMLALGALSDKIGRIPVLLMCLSAFPIRYTLTALIRDAVWVVLIQLFHGLTFAGLYVVGSALLTEEASESVGLALSFFTVAFNLGNVIGGYLLALVQATYGYFMMYMFASAVSAVSIPLLVALSRPKSCKNRAYRRKHFYEVGLGTM
ncbi:MAG: MFS transporter [Thermofilaceae archaeon]